LKRVLRMAEERDILRYEQNCELEGYAHQFCSELIREKSLPMKLVDVEYLFDGSKAIFYFASDGRVDFRELVRDLARQFHTRIEMRQIGVRDEAKMVGGVGCCGRELCCATFLTDFAPISVRMAKDQNVSLNPVKISGICGRLMCCLGYEHKMYEDLARDMPKLGKRVQTPKGEGKVIRRNVLENTFAVVIEGKEFEFTLDQWRGGGAAEGPEAPPTPAAPPTPTVDLPAEPAPAPRPQRPTRPPRPREELAPASSVEPQPAEGAAVPGQAARRRRRRRRGGGGTSPERRSDG
jgi:cell fate regulator YaaT (PSP1 superfamily)